MASSDFLDDIPSSPLSSVPSDFDRSSKSPGPQASLPAKSSGNTKRKAPASRPAPDRASRRLKTEDSFERSLTAIKEDIILPKVAKSRQPTRKQNAAATTDSNGAPQPVESPNAGSNVGQAEVKRDLDLQLVKPDVPEVVPPAMLSLQNPDQELPQEAARELEAIEGDDASQQTSRNSVHETPKEVLHAQQPSPSSVTETVKRPIQEQQPPSAPLNEVLAQPLDAQPPNTEHKDDSVVDAERADTLPLLSLTKTSNIPFSPTVTIPAVEANESPTETTEAAQVGKLPSPEASDETIDELTQDEPRTNVRPSRKRLQPTKLEDYEPPVKAVSTTVKKKAQPLRGNWSVTHLLTNPKSKLATCNLNALLNHENAWTLLSREQQLQLIAMLPPFIRDNFPEFPDDMPIPNVMRQVMQSNNSFQADIRLFQEDLAAGRYDPKWLEDAHEAMEKRAKGHFDDWKERNREEFWGQKQKVDWTTLSGDSAQYTLVDLVKAGSFEVGDIWSLRRGGQGVKVEKEAKICAIAADGALSFTYPPGEHKFSTPANGEDILIERVRTPKTLTDAILNEDGRLAGVRGANAWRDYRCFRKAQDIGSPWDMRELYNVRQSS